MLRRCAARLSVWGSMATSAAATPPSQASINAAEWRPPPQPSSGEFEEAPIPNALIETAHDAMPLDIAMSLDKAERPDPMAARRADLPWPHIETSKSIQIAKVDGDIGIDFWGPRRDRAQRAYEESIVQTDFSWEADPNPVMLLRKDGVDKHVCYDEGYAFKTNHRVVERRVKQQTDLGGTQSRYHLPTTDEVTIRTRERVKPGHGLAYFEVTNHANCLNFGLGVVTPETFTPYEWVGYTRGTYAWYEDGRQGTVGAHSNGSVIKPLDDLGIMLYTPPEAKKAWLMFVRNEEVAGDVIEIPVNPNGWYFAVTMIGYHYGGVKSVINFPPEMLEKAMRHLGRKLHPDDEDFFMTDNKEVFARGIIQERCPNRWNPFHVCSDMCRHAAVTLRSDDDLLGHPLRSDEVPIRPSWNRAAHARQNHTPARAGKWRHKADFKGDRVFRTVYHDWMKNNQYKQKYGRGKAPTWRHGNMKYS